MAYKTAALRHTHQYYLLDGLWHCYNCSHFLPKNVAKTIVTRESVCWSCTKTFRLNKEALEDIKPVCDDCRGQLVSITEYLKATGQLPREIGESIPIQVINRESINETKETSSPKNEVVEDWHEE